MKLSEKEQQLIEQLRQDEARKVTLLALQEEFKQEALKVKLLALQEEFKQEALKVQAQIQEELAKARVHLNQAVKLSEDSGIPFRSYISPISNRYTPDSYQDKWAKCLSNRCLAESEDLESFLDEYDLFASEYEGWQYSAAC